VDDGGCIIFESESFFAKAKAEDESDVTFFPKVTRFCPHWSDIKVALLNDDVSAL
jgi:hypothetical protein